MTEESNSKPAEQNKPKRRLVWIGYTIGGIILAFVVIVLLLPTVISTGAGTRLVVRVIDGKIPGSVQIESVSLGWFTGQYVSGLRLFDPEGKEVLLVKQLDLPDATLGALLFGSRKLGNIDVTDLSADIIQYVDGRTNLQDAIEASPNGMKGSETPAQIALVSNVQLTVPKASHTTLAKTPMATLPIKDLSFNLVAKNMTVDYSLPEQPGIKLNIPQTNINFKDPRQINLLLSATLSQGSSEGQINLTATAKNLMNANGQILLDQAEIDADANIQTFPIDSLDSMLQQHGRLTALLGPTLDATLEADGKLASLNLKVNANSQTIKADADISSDGKTLVANKPATLTLNISPEAWQTLSQDRFGEVNSKLLAPLTLDLMLSHLNVPIDENNINLADMAIELNLNASPIQLQAEDIGEVDLRRTTVTLQADRLGSALIAHMASAATVNGKRGDLMVDANVTDWLTAENLFAKDTYASKVAANLEAFPLASMLDDLLGENNLYMLALGKSVNATIRADYQATENKGKFTAKLDTAYGNVTIDATRSPEGYTLSPETVARYQIQPALLTQLTGSKDLSVQQPIQLTFSLERFEVQNTRGPITPDQVTAGFTLRLDQFSPTQPALQNFSVSNLTLYMHPTTKLSGDIPIQLAAKLHDRDVTADLTGSLAFAFAKNQWQNAELKDTNLNINNFPVLTLDDLTDQNGQLVALLGQTIRMINLKTVGDPRQQISLTATVESDSLNSTIGGKLIREPKQALMKLTPDSKIALTLTPVRYADFMTTSGRWAAAGTTPIRLTSPATLTFAIREGNIPLPFEPEKTMISAKLASTPLDLERQGSGAFQLTDIAGTFTTSDLTKQASLDFNANIQSADDLALSRNRSEANAAPEMGSPQEEGQPVEKQAGRIHVKSELDQLFLSSGKLNLDNLTLNTNTSVQDMPIDLVDQLIRTNGDLVALIGPIGNVKVEGSFPGDMDIDIQSETLNVPAYVHVTRDYVLTLRENFDAKVTPTPQTFSALLSKAQPALADAIASEKPIRLIVNKEDFSVPLTNFQTQNLNMSGTLLLGELRMKRSGWLMQSFTAALRNIGLPLGQSRNTGTYTAMFTPMTFTIRNGVIEPSQVWMISEDLAIGFQVRANLNNNRLDAFMGILGASFILQNPSVFSASFNADQVYSIPLRGAINNPKPDYGFLAINIAGTTGTKAITENTGDLGGLIGGIVGGVGKSINDDKLRKAGLKQWNIPPQAQAVIELAQSEDQSKIVPQNSDQQQEQPQKRRNPDVGDVLRGLFGN
ncbi:hypothetical protein [Poriferisphaera sp. WC338]|uniref:hypothetical protein n=1 Tax=Poriferisphaera sp. WC338 TaxID=3425129 RepID=UPI003D81B229